MDIEKGHNLEYNGSTSPLPNHKRTGLRSESKRRAQQNLKWTNINFYVGKTTILSECWGEVPSGKVCAIMGPSGAGKSSLLNVLAGRSASSPGVLVTGDISVAGQSIDPVTFRNHIAYVMQDDALVPTATPREALRFSASMRLPASTSQETIDGLVEDMLQELALEDCADTMIGGALIKGISGGQRKRTSVGIEVITQPSLLFLDEPTSGLDSFAAFNCIKLLQQLAEDNAAVLCTIHQPSSEVFHLFDRVIVMKDGRVLYQGSVPDITTYFASFGYNCPINYNPADYAMFICQSTAPGELEQKDMFMKEREETSLKQQQKQQRDETAVAVAGAVGSSDVTTTISKEKFLPVAQASFLRQLHALTIRECQRTIRDVASLGARFMVTIILNLLFGLIFYGAGGKDDSDPNNFNSHFGAVTMIVISSMMGSAQPVLLQFPSERPIFLREFSVGTYGATSYFMNLNGNFILLVLACWGLGISASSTAVMLGCLVKEVKQATELAPLLFVPQLLFAGFFVRTSLIPPFLRWAQYLCFVKYTMNLVLLNEFDAGNASCRGTAAAACRGVLRNNDIETTDWWIYILVLVALFVAFRIIGAIILVQKARRFY